MFTFTSVIRKCSLQLLLCFLSPESGDMVVYLVTIFGERI